MKLNDTQSLQCAVLAYAILNANEDGNAWLSSNRLAVMWGVTRRQVEYAVNSIVVNGFDKFMTNSRQIRDIVKFYDTKGNDYAVTNLCQRFDTIVTNISLTYENLKICNNISLENNNFQGISKPVAEISSETEKVEEKERKKKDEEKESFIKEREEKEINKEREDVVGQKPKIDFKRIVDMYNSTCKSWAKCKMLTEKRKAGIVARWTELSNTHPTFNVYDLIQRIFEKVEASDFLCGRTASRTTACFGFDWIFCCKGNYIKIIEGTYDNKQQPTRVHLTPQQQYEEECEERLRKERERNALEAQRRHDERFSVPVEERIANWLKEMRVRFKNLKDATDEEIKAQYPSTIQRFYKGIC